MTSGGGFSGFEGIVERLIKEIITTGGAE